MMASRQKRIRKVAKVRESKVVECLLREGRLGIIWDSTKSGSPAKPKIEPARQVAKRMGRWLTTSMPNVYILFIQSLWDGSSRPTVVAAKDIFVPDEAELTWCQTNTARIAPNINVQFWKNFSRTCPRPQRSQGAPHKAHEHNTKNNQKPWRPW